MRIFTRSPIEVKNYAKSPGNPHARIHACPAAVTGVTEQLSKASLHSAYQALHEPLAVFLLSNHHDHTPDLHNVQSESTRPHHLSHPPKWIMHVTVLATWHKATTCFKMANHSHLMQDCFWVPISVWVILWATFSPSIWGKCTWVFDSSCFHACVFERQCFRVMSGNT